MGRDYKLANGGKLYTQANSTEFQIAGSTGLLYSNGIPQNYFEDGTTAANLKAYGVSFLTQSTAQSMKTYTLDAPIKGTVKELVLQSTIAPLGSSDTAQVATGSSDIDIISFGTTAVAIDLTNIAMQTPYTYVRLIGVSTSRWALTNLVTASTLATYKAGTALSSGLSTGVTST